MTGAITYAGYTPGTLSDVIGAHMAYYAPAWGFGAAFEAKLAAEMGAFLARFDPAWHLILTARQGDRFCGSIVIDGDDPQGAHLRWFITTEHARGQGIGRALLTSALGFADTLDADRVWLTTFAGLEPARRLYEEAGFTLIREEPTDQWQGGVQEQRYEKPL